MIDWERVVESVRNQHARHNDFASEDVEMFGGDPNCDHEWREAGHFIGQGNTYGFTYLCRRCFANLHYTYERDESTPL